LGIISAATRTSLEAHGIGMVIDHPLCSVWKYLLGLAHHFLRNKKSSTSQAL
jgi:hypothetical protein